MPPEPTSPEHRPILDEEAALRAVVEGTAAETGDDFFRALVRQLARTLGTDGAWVTEYLDERRRLRARAFWLGDDWVPEYEYAMEGTPCEHVVDQSDVVHVPDQVVTLYPSDPDLARFGAVSYLGVPLVDFDGSVLGHLAVMDNRPMPAAPKVEALMRIFAARATGEFQRLRVEGEVREREEKLRLLVGSAMDAILELDERYRVTLANPASEKLFARPAEQLTGESVGQLLSDESRATFPKFIAELDARPPGQRSLWIPGGLVGRRAEGDEFPAEATISRYDHGRRTFYTVILRNVQERVRAERAIHALASEAEYLREELQELRHFDELLGESSVMRRLRHEIREVAETNATVLVLGETGTGKELVARAIHAESARRDRPLVRVNCAAVPAGLIESEFFGHEKGAFTGATQRREGRFALADSGTIFLDEVGELPLDLQVKLLRVLQEGDFEPVGSSRTQHVDVRIIAATNRNLEEAVRAGAFRRDLFYRLNVFPITVPPLRLRDDDVVLLATAFAQRFARRLGRSLEPLTATCAARLRAYEWPGNVRELANVIERAVITSQDTRLNLDRALPGTGQPPDRSPPTADTGSEPIRTAQEFRDLERRNLLRALNAADWKVSGPAGAAELLGMKPTTVQSRMKALGIKRPG